MFRDGSSTETIEIEYPIGHRRRREEGIPVLEEKFSQHLATRFSTSRCEKILGLCRDQAALEVTPVNRFMDWWVS